MHLPGCILFTIKISCVSCKNRVEVASTIESTAPESFYFVFTIPIMIDWKNCVTYSF